ncbi:synapsin-1 isoform X2 [Triticum aestivum]|uniref:synapsin-1 isoform X2 n=1 Tax=Triticum aestivum TaxID=4565 RepID=UPI001D009757|nr:synapsin-1-like isoform X2 [Triticum aestivum]
MDRVAARGPEQERSASSPRAAAVSNRNHQASPSRSSPSVPSSLHLSLSLISSSLCTSTGAPAPWSSRARPAQLGDSKPPRSNSPGGCRCARAASREPTGDPDLQATTTRPMPPRPHCGPRRHLIVPLPATSRSLSSSSSPVSASPSPASCLAPTASLAPQASSRVNRVCCHGRPHRAVAASGSTAQVHQGLSHGVPSSMRCPAGPLLQPELLSLACQVRRRRSPASPLPACDLCFDPAPVSS